MADALCGPSNSLQSFQKHTTVDRTLQQDRGASRPSPIETFRSSPGHNTGLLDAEFEAFQTGNPLETGYPEPPLFHYGSSTNNPHTDFQQADWASDFQSLHLDDQRASPFLSSQFHQDAPIQRSAQNAWHQDFLRQQRQSNTQPLPRFGHSNQPHLHNTASFSSVNIPMYGYGEHLSTATAGKQYDVGRNAAQEDEMFSKAFEQAQTNAAYHEISYGLESESQNHFAERAKNEHMEESQAEQMREAQERSKEDTPEEVQYRIGSDRILDESREQGDEYNDADDADELARTAGSLLENVKGDTSKKFQESNFLSLMRQLRDREVTVDGDKIVDTMQPLHPGGVHYPHDSRVEAGLNTERSAKRAAHGSSQMEALA